MVLFLANTMTQLLNAIVIKKTLLQNENCDVYYTENLRDYATKAQESGAFDNAYQITLVKDICSRDSSVKRAIVRIKNALDFSLVKKMLPSDPMLYSRVYASGISLRNYEFYYAIKCKNSDVKLSLYEEGLCEYYTLGLPHSFARALFSHLFFHHYYFEECDSVYVYAPGAVKNTWNNIAVKRIPGIYENSEIISLINKVFGYEPTELKNAEDKVIILEQSYYDEKQIKEQEEIIQMLAEVFGKDRIIIKLHPRSEKNKYGSEYQYVNTKIPLEIIALNENIDRNNVFVSISSSSVLNFKMMLNREPRILLLNKFLNPGADEGGSWHVFEYVRNAYSNDHFYMPVDKDDLLRVVKVLSQKN